MSMKYIKRRPTADFPDACLLSIRRVGEPHFYRTFNTIKEAQKFRDQTFPRLIASAKQKRATDSLERKSDPAKCEFRDTKVIDLIKLLVAAEKAEPVKKHPNRRGTWERVASGSEDFIGSVTVRELLPAWATAYTQKLRSTNTRLGKPYSYQTISHHFMLISRAVRAEAFALNLPKPELPFATKELFPAKWQSKRVRRVRGDDEAAIRESAARSSYSAQWGDLITLALETGARLQEMVMAEWSEFDLVDRVWLMPQEHTKCDKARGVPLSRKATDTLRKLYAERPKGENRVLHEIKSPELASAQFHRIVKQAGVTDLRLHDMRHEFCSRILTKRDGPGLKAVMDMVGHSSPEMINRYAHLEARDFVERMG